MDIQQLQALLDLLAKGQMATPPPGIPPGVVNPMMSAGGFPPIPQQGGGALSPDAVAAMFGFGSGQQVGGPFTASAAKPKPVAKPKKQVAAQ